MKFDTVIIGGGLSGLVCGIRLTQQGQHCAIVSSGQSALHFSSGSFDLLNTLPNGRLVNNPLSALKDLVKLAPSHPYSKLGDVNFERLTQEAEMFFSDIGIQMYGDRQKNHYRITPIGALRPTWLTMCDLAVSESEKELPWKKVSIFNVDGFLDFHPQFIADELRKIGANSELHTFDLPDLKYIRRNPSELRSPNIARILDKKRNINELIKILSTGSKNSDAVILPAIIGLSDPEISKYIEHAIGKPVLLVATLPPSIVGIRTQKFLHDYFIRLGGTYMLGDTIRETEIKDQRVTKLYSYNHGDIPFTCDNVVLASGSYFSQGLVATQDSIYEPIFGLDVSYLSDRKEWYNIDVFDAQGYQKFGVKTNHSFNGIYKGHEIDNLYVSGAVLEGFNPIKEGCGAGVSILSALYIADRISGKQN